MTDLGWVQNVQRRWLNPVRASRALRSFASAA
jgi:hypothetical protein